MMRRLVENEEYVVAMFLKDCDRHAFSHSPSVLTFKYFKLFIKVH